MFSEKCNRAIKRALKLMEEEAPVYSTGPSLTNSAKVRDFWLLRLSNRKNERFEVLFLDSQHKQIACETLFNGTINAAAVYPRVIIQRAIELNAVAIILAHNHPSGTLSPSTADKSITKTIQEACKLIDVSVLDHVIVGKGTYSFTEHGDI